MLPSAPGYSPCNINTDILQLHSKGLFSSYCLYRAHNILFDCGDGCAQELGYDIFKPDRVFLSHHHVDHTAGLLSLIGLRAFTKGANDKPLIVHYPFDRSIEQYLQFIRDQYPPERLPYRLSFEPVRPGDVIRVGPKTFVRAFRTKHTRTSLGFVVFEETRRLKHEYQGQDIRALIQEQGLDKDQITVPAEFRKFAYVLDNCGFPFDEVEGVKEIVLDCTFLKEEDRERDSHASFQECMTQVAAIQPETYHLAHISPRYPKHQIQSFTQK